MSLGAAAPVAWNALSESELGEDSLLSTNQCVIQGKYFFILGRLELPVVDSPDNFVWLVWVSLSEKIFMRACELWDQVGRESEPPYFGWLQSALPYKPSTLNLKVSLQTQRVGQRPIVALEATNHPLAIEQREGIDLSRVQEIVEMALDD